MEGIEYTNKIFISYNYTLGNKVIKRTYRYYQFVSFSFEKRLLNPIQLHNARLLFVSRRSVCVARGIALFSSVTMMSLRSLLTLLLVSAPFVADSKSSSWTRVRRVKAGKSYDEHEPVHVVVNKVGYVCVCLLISRRNDRKCIIATVRVVFKKLSGRERGTRRQ